MKLRCFLLCFLVLMENPGGSSASLGEALGITSCETDDIDLTFLVDSSVSVDMPSFKKMLGTVLNIVKYFNTDDGHLRTAVVIFGKGAKVLIHLSDYSDELSLSNAIVEIGREYYSRTDIGTAITIAKRKVYKEENGHRPHALKLLILLTDGQSQNKSHTYLMAERARRSGIFILAVGIGSSIDHQELRDIAGMDEAVISVTHFPDLEAVAAATLSKICPPCEERAGWMQRNDMCYLVRKVTENISWLEASRRCRDKNGDLATVRGARDEDFLFRRMSPETQTAYIGLRQAISSTSPGHMNVFFQWQDGTYLRYTHWKDNAPEGFSDKGCVLMNGSSGWELAFCRENITNQFICMKSPLAPTDKVDESLGIPSCQFDDIDLTFLVDSSARVQASNFKRMLETVVSITNYFNNKDDHLRTAVVTYGTEANVPIQLNQYSDELSLSEAILSIQYEPQNHTKIGLAIATATDVIYKEENGHRPHAFKLLILLTGGKSRNSSYTNLMAKRARRSGIIILALGIGWNINERELRRVAGKDEAVVLVSDFTQLKAVSADILSRICPACEERAGWMHHGEVCYLIQKAKDSITWLEARRRCRRYEAGDLATIQGSSDEDFLLRRMSHDLKTAYIGLKKDYTTIPGKFKDIFRWQDGTPLIYKHWKEKEPNGGSLERCVIFDGSSGWKDIFCGEKITNQFVCTKPALDKSQLGEKPPILPELVPDVNNTILKNCKNGELVSMLNVCNGRFDCRDKSDEAECGDGCEETMFSCGNKRCISLTFYCDGTSDCDDKSDEETCKMAPCTDQEWRCQNGQCLEDNKRCDLHSDCLDNSDETDCDVCRGFQCYDGGCIPTTWVGDGTVDCSGFKREDETAAAVISVSAKYSVINTASIPDCLYQPDAFGKVSLRVSKRSRNCYFYECPDMFYKCPASYCIPVHAVCNGLFDCLHGEDEANCHLFSCPGYYRCQGEQYCIHPSHLCDDTRHCPKGDDERYCEQPCPPFCECHGRVITCKENFTFSEPIPKDVRKLDVSGQDIQPNSTDLSGLHYLTILILSNCGLTNVDELLPYLPNLIELDLSNNKIQVLPNGSFHSVRRLKYLDLSGNVLLTSIENGTFAPLELLEILNLKNTGLQALTETSFLGLSQLRSLDLSRNAIKEISENAFAGLEILQSLDLRGNDIEQFGEGIFNGLDSLGKLFTDSYKLCCDIVRPKSLDSENCISTGANISSCHDLLGQRILRTMLWCIAVIAVIGNILVLAYRFKYDRKSLQKSYGIFVTNLSVSDCLMGIYMMIIGSADAKYRGSYVWNDYEWRHSHLCKFAGSLATLSSEASCIFITLITLDRFLAIRFPFGQVKCTRISTTICVIVTWFLAAVLATVPLLPSFDHWALFSQNSVCLAMPFSSERKPGWYYATSLCVGFNLALFLIIAVGQILIYRSVKSSSKIRPGGTDDNKIARRLFLVVFTDFLCWFPVGVMGIMALQGFPISKEVYAWTAVTILPVNSALNPILYTVPSMIQARRELMKRKQTTEKTTSSLQGVTLESIPVHKCRKYVGNPTIDMENLRTVLNANDVSSDVKFDLISLIVAYVLDLHENERRFQPISDDNVYIKRRGEEILSICLYLEPDSERCGLTEDVLNLIQLLKEQRYNSDIQQERCDPTEPETF